MKKIIASSVLTASMFTPTAYATLATNAVLDFDDGIWGCMEGAGTYPDCLYDATTVSSGSYFSMDASGDGVFQESERVAIASAGIGLTLGAVQDVGDIDLEWSWGGGVGWHYTTSTLTVTSTGSNTADIDMSGWDVWWGPLGGLPSQQLGSKTDGTVASVICGVDCSEGDTFVLDYIANIGDFHPFYYGLHLEGTVVPVPAAVWLFGSGLVGLIGIARRKKS